MKSSVKTISFKMLIVFSVVAVLLAVSSIQADTFKFMDINFDGDTIGSAPSTGPAPNPLTAGAPITTVQAIGGYNTSPLPDWDPGYQSPPTPDCGTLVVGNVSGMSNAAVLTTNSSNGELGALWMDTGFSMTSTQVTLKFELNVLAAPARATAQPKYLNDTSDQAGILFGINTFTDAGRAFCFAAAPTSDTGGVFALRSADNTRLITFGNYVEGQTYNLTLSADYTTGMVDAYVDGALAISGDQFWSSGVSTPTTTSEFFMHLNGESGYANQIAIDNIQAFNTAVPEPGTLTLLGLAGLFGLATVWIRRRRLNG
ncbi:MAG: PEP-CTERM sorting domain-containing protein [Thermoguttaceae bacterium]|jgi:hypothetical protein